MVCRCCAGPSPDVSVAGGHFQVRRRGQWCRVWPAPTPSGTPDPDHLRACLVRAGPKCGRRSCWIAGARVSARPPRRLRILPAILVPTHAPLAALTPPSAASPQRAAVHSSAEARGPAASPATAAAVTHSGHAAPLSQWRSRGAWRLASWRQRGVRRGPPVGLHGRRRQREPAAQRQPERSARPRLRARPFILFRVYHARNKVSVRTTDHLIMVSLRMSAVLAAYNTPNTLRHSYSAGNEFIVSRDLH